MSGSELDKWFGTPLAPSDEPGKRTRYPHVPERYRGICDRFTEMWVERTGQEMGPWLKEQIFPAARDWVAEHGETPDLLERSFLSMEKKGLTIATPRSLIREGYELKKNTNANDEVRRRRYLKGLEGD